MAAHAAPFETCATPWCVCVELVNITRPHQGDGKLRLVQPERPDPEDHRRRSGFGENTHDRALALSLVRIRHLEKN